MDDPNAMTQPTLPSPHLVLIGDSTVQSYAPEATNIRGWGQYLAAYLKPGINVTNLALGGRSSKSFALEENYQTFMKMHPAPDFLIMQFGHNDNLNANKGERETTPLPMPEQLPASGTGSKLEDYYRHNLAEYVHAAVLRGVRPVIVTPMERFVMSEGDIRTLIRKNEPYAQAAIEVGKALKVTTIDLNTYSAACLTTWSREESLSHQGVNTKTGEPDLAHHCEKGARCWAMFIAEQLGEAFQSLRT